MSAGEGAEQLGNPGSGTGSCNWTCRATSSIWSRVVWRCWPGVAACNTARHWVQPADCVEVVPLPATPGTTCKTRRKRD